MAGLSPDLSIDGSIVQLENGDTRIPNLIFPIPRLFFTSYAAFILNIPTVSCYWEPSAW